MKLKQKKNKQTHKQENKQTINQNTKITNPPRHFSFSHSKEKKINVYASLHKCSGNVKLSQNVIKLYLVDFQSKIILVITCQLFQFQARMS